MKKMIATFLSLLLVISFFVSSVSYAETGDILPSDVTDNTLEEAPNASEETTSTPEETPIESEEAPIITEEDIVETDAVYQENGETEIETMPQGEGQIGSERIFSVPGVFANQTPATLAASSEHALVYVVKSDTLSTYKNFYPDGTNENAEAKAVAQRFEEMYTLLSTPGTASYYAQPYNINGDGKVIILLCDVYEDGKESGGTVGGYASGLFNSADFTSGSKGAVIYADIAPNQGYLKLKNDPDAFFQTIAHEYAHMLSFSCVYTNRKAGKSADLKDVFAEEAFAELASYLYINKFNGTKMSSFFTNQFQPHYGFIDWQYNGVFAYASYGAATLMGLTYYNHGGNINEFLMDTRGGRTNSLIAMGDHMPGKSNSTTLNNFDEFFNKFALDTFVSDPSKKGPYIKNVSFDSWLQINLSYQPMIKPGEAFAYSANVTPYMPRYFVRPRMGEKLPVDANVIKMTLTDAAAKSRFYVVYPDQPFSSFDYASARNYTELIPGQEITIPVGQGNEFVVLGVNFNYSNTDASIKYTTAKDPNYPFENLQVPEVQNLKVEHAKSNIEISWNAPSNVPASLKMEKYEVYRDEELIKTVYASASSLSCTELYSKLEEGKRYEYTVKTVATLSDNITKLTSVGAKKSFTLLPAAVNPPSNLTAVADEDGTSIVLKWKKAEAAFGDVRKPEPSGYEIYRDDVLIYSPGSSSESYSDSKVELGRSYTYQMRSKYTSNGKTVYSEYTPKVTVSNISLYPPQNLKAVQTNETIALSWSKPSQGIAPTEYAVYCNGNKIATTYALQYDNTNLKPGTYSYYVTSVQGSYESSASNTASVTISAKNAAKPSITVQPLSKKVRQKATWRISVKATVKALESGSAKLSYQWYKNSTYKNTGGTKITGATSTSYKVPTTRKGTAYYYCIVTNRDSAATGTTAATTASKAIKIIVV